MRRMLCVFGLIVLMFADGVEAQPLVSAKPDPVSFVVVLGNSPSANSWNQCLEANPTNTCSQNLTVSQRITSVSVRQISTARVNGASVTWISANSLTTVNSTTLKVTVNAANLPSGDYLAAITVGAAGAKNSPITVPVEFHVFPTAGYSTNPPAITATGPTSFTINSAKINNFSGALSIVAVDPPGAGLVTFADAPGSATKNITAQGSSYKQNINVNVSGLDTSTLPNGASAYIYFSDANGTGSTQEVVLLPTLVADVSPISFSYSPGGSAGSQTVTISTNYVNPILFTPSISGGNGVFSMTMVTPQGSSCTTPCQLRISVKSGQTGVFSGTLNLSPSTQNALPLSIPLTLSAGGSLSVNASVLDFHLPAGSTNPPPTQPVTVSSTGASTAFTVQADSWILLDHTSGMTGSPSATVNVTLNPPTIPNGAPALGQITFTSPSSSSRPSVIVEAFVTNSFTAPASLSFSQGGPASQTFNLGSAGAALPFVIQSDSTWLMISPSTGMTPQQITVGANSSGLAPNTYSGNLIASDQTGNTPSLTIPVTFSVQSVPSTTRVLPHVGDGNGFKTTIILTNCNTVAASYSLVFHGDDGNPPSSRFELEAGALSGTIQPGKSVTIRTAGLGTQTVPGWAEVTIPTTAGVGVIYSQPGKGTIQEGTPTIAANGSSHFFLPFDGTSGAVTGAALTNAGNNAANNVLVTLRYSDGTSETLPWGSLAAKSHHGVDMAQQFPRAAGKSGVAEFASDHPLYAVVFRFNSTAAFTALGVVPASGSNNVITRTISHIGDGNFFKTAFLLTNTDTVTASYTLKLYGDDGNPPASRFELETGSLSGTISPGRSVTIRTAGLGSQTVPGWAELVAPATVGGSVIYSQPGQGTIQEGTLDISAVASQHFFLSFDNTNGAITGLAITNAGTAAANNVTVTLRYDDGSSETVPWGSVVAAKSHRGGVMSQQFLRTAGRSGVAEFNSDQPLYAVVFRFNSTGAYTALGVTPR